MSSEKGNNTAILRGNADAFNPKNTPKLIKEGLYNETRGDVVETLHKDIIPPKFQSELDGLSGNFSDFIKHSLVQLNAQKKMNFELKKVESNRMAEFNRIAEENIKLNKKIEELEEQVTTDPLTQIHNRRYLEEEGPKEFERSERKKVPLSVAMIDIDHFKKVNDDHDHAFGDEVLHEVAQTIKKQIREVDTVARYGGEEFTLVFPETDMNVAWDIMERVRNAVKDLEFDYNGKKVSVSVSAGLSTFYPNDHDNKADDEYNNIDELIKRADGELMTAKQTGRDRVCCAEPKVPEMYKY